MHGLQRILAWAIMCGIYMIYILLRESASSE